MVSRSPSSLASKTTGDVHSTAMRAKPSRCSAPLTRTASGAASGFAACAFGSGAAALAGELGLTVLRDRSGDAAGPLAGVRAGLAWAAGREGEWLATVPCDAPLLPADLGGRLLGALGEAGAAVAETEGGMEPLCALWRVSALPALEAELAEGRHPAVHQVLERLGA